MAKAVHCIPPKSGACSAHQSEAACGQLPPQSIHPELHEVDTAASPAAPSSLAGRMPASGCFLYALQPACTTLQSYNRLAARSLGFGHLAPFSLSCMKQTLQQVLLRLSLLKNTCQLLAALCTLCVLRPQDHNRLGAGVLRAGNRNRFIMGNLHAEGCEIKTLGLGLGDQVHYATCLHHIARSLGLSACIGR